MTILLTRLRGVQRRYTGVYERFRMGVDMQIKIDVIIFFERIIYTRKIVFAVERRRACF